VPPAEGAGQVEREVAAEEVELHAVMVTSLTGFTRPPIM
jgi:hypothetical protein